MKKAIKIIVSILVVCAGVAGGLLIYNKIKEKKSLMEDDDFDDDFDDDLTADEDDDADNIEREYVNINPSSEGTTEE